METHSQRLTTTYFLSMSGIFFKKSHIFLPSMPEVLSEGMFQRGDMKDSYHFDSEVHTVIIL